MTVPNQPTGTAPPSRRLSVTATICGVLAVLIGWIPFVGLIGFGLAVAAVVTGAVAVRRPGERALAIVGLVCGALVIAAWTVVLAIAVTLAFEGRLPR